ncbi:DUF177 domain-containing protein [Geovibrio thiophilus]|uniref:DUF177 domain-containing protein n=1 Tax=Geovibrio thiophilus TaxID=139438 RepID=A0A410JUP1_9BACT|nr:DUF177 domain-containing protein [Geovibrio thiophilus]QAR31902.1 DUF177 domain-containing protein [Geovibrio thiophilus]
MKVILEDIENTGIEIKAESCFAFDGGKFESVIFTGRLLPVGDKKSEFYLDGKITAKVVMPCDRCLEAVSLELGGDVNVRIVRTSAEELPEELELEDDDVSAYTVEGDELETDEITEQEALLLLPMKVTCAKPCGSELIKDENDEIVKEGDPRWDALNKLKNN